MAAQRSSVASACRPCPHRRSRRLPRGRPRRQRRAPRARAHAPACPDPTAAAGNGHPSPSPSGPAPPSAARALRWRWALVWRAAASARNVRVYLAAAAAWVGRHLVERLRPAAFDDSPAAWRTFAPRCLPSAARPLAPRFRPVGRALHLPRRRRESRADDEVHLTDVGISPIDVATSKLISPARRRTTSRCVFWFIPLLLSPLPLACPTDRWPHPPPPRRPTSSLDCGRWRRS